MRPSLPKLLLSLAGIASAGYLAWRRRPEPTFTKELSLASLGSHLENWLPKLPYVPFIRLEAPDAGATLWLRGDGRTVLVSAPQSTTRHGELTPRFRRACATLDIEARETREHDELRLTCRVPATEPDVAQVLEAMLRTVYELGPDARLTVTVPLTG